jgi:hypothetical protein
MRLLCKGQTGKCFLLFFTGVVEAECLISLELKGGLEAIPEVTVD